MKYLYLTLLVFLFACSEEKTSSYDAVYSDDDQAIASSYVGDQNCITCHKDASNDWMGSHHQLAMQEVSEATVLADFNDHAVELDGVSYFFYREGDTFKAKVTELDGEEYDFTISYVFGITPLQQYMVDFDKGRKQVMRATWDTEKNRWFHQYAGDKIDQNDWLHWTRGGQNWNTMCAECHSTDLKKNYDVVKDSFHTTYSSINVSCESCHGPGQRHVKWANSGGVGKDPSLILGADQASQLSMCAPCHARRVKLTRDLTPGLKFEDQYLVQNISTDFYHGDGQILEEDYVYGSFLQSKMHGLGIKCNDCHNVHSLELKAEGNDLCLQCHVPDTYESKEHHFHQLGTEASQCVNCHMTGRYYMGNDFRRDHSFRIPRPDQSVAYGTPNACTGCHADKSDEWAAEWVVKWYGNERVDHFSDYLLMSNEPGMTIEDRKKFNSFINDLNYPAIARSTVIANLSYTNEEEYRSILQSLKDSAAIVRYNALMQFRGLNPQERVSIARNHMNDPSLLVRMGSAQLLTGFSGEGFSEAERLQLTKVQSELETMLFSNADFSTGRLQLGDYFLQTNDLNAAIEHYEMALAKDSLLFPVYTNVATAYSLRGENDKALETLNIWIDLDANASRPYYLRALLNFELGNNEIAVEDLEMAIELDPQDTRSMYNLATYYYQQKQFDRSKELIETALKLESGNRELLYLYALVLRDTGETQRAEGILRQLQ